MHSRSNVRDCTWNRAQRGAPPAAKRCSMKPSVHPTSVEVQVPKGEFIVSKTDPTGRITYVNRTFMQVANFREADLLGRQHNIIRHPDMPRGVFKLLSDTLKGGSEFFGFVKNMT